MIETEFLTMTITQEDFQEKWNTKEKVLIRGTVPKDIAKAFEDMAIKEFGLDQAARGKTLTKLLMIAFESLENQTE